MIADCSDSFAVLSNGVNKTSLHPGGVVYVFFPSLTCSPLQFSTSSYSLFLLLLTIVPDSPHREHTELGMLLSTLGPPLASSLTRLRQRRNYTRRRTSTTTGLPL